MSNPLQLLIASKKLFLTLSGICLIGTKKKTTIIIRVKDEILPMTFDKCKEFRRFIKKKSLVSKETTENNKIVPIKVRTTSEQDNGRRKELGTKKTP